MMAGLLDITTCPNSESTDKIQTVREDLNSQQTLLCDSSNPETINLIQDDISALDQNVEIKKGDKYFQNEGNSSEESNDLCNQHVVYDKLENLPGNDLTRGTKRDTRDKMWIQAESILKKPKPQNHYILVTELQSLHVKSELDMNEIASLLLDQVISCPADSLYYATVCKCLSLSGFSVQPKSLKLNKVIFQKISKEFENPPYDAKLAAKTKNGAAYPELQNTETKENFYTRLTLIRFVGDLVNVGVSNISKPKISALMKKLLMFADEESLKCLCILLIMVYEKMASGKSAVSKNDMEDCISELEALAKNTDISVTLKSLIRSVVAFKTDYKHSPHVSFLPSHPAIYRFPGNILPQSGVSQVTPASLYLSSLPRKPVVLPVPVNIYMPPIPPKNSVHVPLVPLLPYNPIVAGLPVSVVQPPVHPVNISPFPLYPAQITIPSLKPMASRVPLNVFNQYGTQPTIPAEIGIQNPTANTRQVVKLPAASGASLQPKASGTSLQPTLGAALRPTASGAALQPIPNVKVSDKSPPSASSKGVKIFLLDMLKRDEPNEEIERWIDVLRSAFNDSEKKVVREIVSAVHENAVKGIGTDCVEFDSSEVKKRIPLLNHLLKKDEALELEAVYALQRLLHELGHPPGVLHQMFDFLFEEEVIDIVAFVRWKKIRTSSETLGREEALASVQMFYQVGTKKKPLHS